MRLAQGDAARAEAELGGDVESWPAPLKVHALGVRARVRLALERLEEARTDASRALELLEELGEIEEGEAVVRLAFAEVAAATGRDSMARAAIDGAERRLLERAEPIRDPKVKARFLERVPEHARTPELAQRA